ncbi:hypothetical protein D3C80_1216000 [compost metagenome]
MTAQLHRHRLHAVAYAKHRNAGFKDVLRRARAVVFSGAFRATRQNNAAWIKFTDLCFRDIPCPQFTINAKFTNATSNELRVLGAEVQDKNAMFMNVFRH